MDQATELTRRQPNFLTPRTPQELFLLAQWAMKCGMASSPEQAAVKMAFGMEIGISPFQALQTVNVIKGKAVLEGKGVMALLLRDGALEKLEEGFEGQGPTRRYWCKLYRKGIPTPFEGRYSMEDARRANLLGKENWKYYPDRMLQWRARHNAADDGFGDILRGLVPQEVIEDYNGFAAGGGPVRKTLHLGGSSKLVEPLAPEAPTPEDTPAMEEELPPADAFIGEEETIQSVLEEPPAAEPPPKDPLAPSRVSDEPIDDELYSKAIQKVVDLATGYMGAVLEEHHFREPVLRKRIEDLLDSHSAFDDPETHQRVSGLKSLKALRQKPRWFRVTYGRLSDTWEEHFGHAGQEENRESVA